jgi:hypothetical protein
MLSFDVDSSTSFAALPAGAGPMPRDEAQSKDLLGLAGGDAGGGGGPEGEESRGGGMAMTTMHVVANRLIGSTFLARDASADAAAAGDAAAAAAGDTMSTPLAVTQAVRCACARPTSK